MNRFEMPDGKLFTLEEAERSLPLVRRIAEDIVSTHAEMRALLDELNQLPGEEAQAERMKELEKNPLDLQASIRRYVGELEQIGCFIKDFETGLIDWFTEMDGEIVYLCWRLGEETIEHWHTIEDGLAGRQPIPQHIPR